MPTCVFNALLLIKLLTVYVVLSHARHQGPYSTQPLHPMNEIFDSKNQ